jgi:hypothetical protein
MTADNVPETSNIRNTWIVARSMGGDLAPVTSAEAAAEFDQWLVTRDAEVEANVLEEIAADTQHGWAIGTWLVDVAAVKRGQMTEAEIKQKWGDNK